MRIPAVAIPILRGHVVPLDRRQMTSPLGRSIVRRGRAIAFIRIHRPLPGTDMPQVLGIRKIRGGRGHFVDQAGLHIHTICSL